MHLTNMVTHLKRGDSVMMPTSMRVGIQQAHGVIALPRGRRAAITMPVEPQATTAIGT